ncbi:hypothetical protein STAS_19137 [Striga asiatica]|uniref:F-box domain-containing protein n=1 Tax=Striga asiatica TaxID=4170 RepID=A0A5A7QAR6_STRAF|nr:hypothetical protein STAS_19137 [Striga asiatica]
MLSVKIIFPFLKWYCRRFTPLIPGFSSGSRNPSSSSSPPFDDDVMGRIFSSLLIGQRARMRLVCRSWKDTIDRADFPVRPEPPWLITPHHEPTFPACLTLESPSENRKYRHRLPPHLVSGGRRWSCRGSGCGWLLLVGHTPASGHRSTEMVLWDPLSGATQSLPSVTTLPFFDELATGCRKHELDFSSPLVTSRARVSHSSTVAVVFSLVDDEYIHRNAWDRLAVCSPGDPTWTAVLPNNNNDDGETNRYSDILFHGGRLFAVCPPWDPGSRPFVSKTSTHTLASSANLEVVTCELAYGGDFSESDEDEDNDVVGLSDVLKDWIVAEHLVGCEEDDELLLVSSTLDLFSHNFDMGGGKTRVYKCPQTRRFEVRRLRVNGDGLLLSSSLEKVEQMGDKCIYLGDTGSISMEGVSEDDEPNCIRYATMDGVGMFRDTSIFNPDNMYSVHEIGVFNVAEERIQRTCMITTKTQLGSCSGWFTPALRF